MSGIDLKARGARLIAEQKQRLDKEKARLAREAAVKQRQLEREQERDLEKQRKRLAELEAEKQAEERRIKQLEDNNGVFYQATLQGVPANEEQAIARGIRRARDKIILPSHVSSQLMSQDAPKNGAMLFEIRSSSGAYTHAGVLAFTAPDGVVGLPRKVCESLWGTATPQAPSPSQPASSSPSLYAPIITHPTQPGISLPWASAAGAMNDSGLGPATTGPMADEPGDTSQPSYGPVTVTYRRLNKGTFVCFQPLVRGFHEAVGDDVRAVLEQGLIGYSTLTEGDVVHVEHQGQNFALKVKELQPDNAVSIIDTDIEAEVVPSLETEEYIRDMEARAAEQAAQLAAMQAEQERLAAEALEAARRAEEEEAARQREQAAEWERIRVVKEASLPPEPPADCSAPTTMCNFQLPNGGRVGRRFLLTDDLDLLFTFCDVRGPADLAESYQLVTRFPRRVFQRGTMASLGDNGLAAGQELLLVEPLAADDAS